MTLVEFLKARLDEDERAAVEAAHDLDDERARAYVSSGEWFVDHRNTVLPFEDGAPRIATANSKAKADHIARHDPASVLRDVAAKRRIIAEYEEVDGRSDVLDCVLRHLAATYDDHADYRAEWA